MIELLTDLPDGVVGVVASGHVSAEDYETVLMPAVEAAFKTHDKLKFLYQLNSDFTGFTPVALWDDMRVGLAHLRSWEKVAVVTDVSWVAHATSLFRFVMPCPMRVFSIKDRAEAEAWLSA